MSDWISVKERVPEQGQMVLVSGGGFVSVEIYPYEIARMMGKLAEEQFDCPATTHWMPLPEPPQDTP